jgi:hypothetical protein
MSSFNMPNSDGAEPERMSESDRAAVVNALAEEAAELFHGYVAGEVSFEELTFEMFDTLQTLYAIASGDVSIEYEYEYEADDADLQRQIGELLRDNQRDTGDGQKEQRRRGN